MSVRQFILSNLEARYLAPRCSRACCTTQVAFHLPGHRMLEMDGSLHSSHGNRLCVPVMCRGDSCLYSGTARC